MSRIDKLSILGVRSFDNCRSETIQFHTPLTLIVGYNGSGKTTIIECLKYATTGELPPNAKVGGAFIHDPKLCGEKEVLAQVKVSFKSTEGTRMVCTRNLQLTVKKTTRSTKTLEGSLMMLRDGDRLTMSSRVAEMDTMMPQYLGASKAVLDSVMFCHQEESLWPLSEPAKLKQRFDEIFEALKYTKALDNIKTLQKNQRTQLALYRKDAESTKIDRDRGSKMQQQGEKIFNEIEELRTQSETKAGKIKEAATNAEAAWQRAETAGMIAGQLTGKRIEASTKEESVQNLRQNLHEMSDSDESLRQMLEQYLHHVEKYEAELADRNAQLEILASKLQEARGLLVSKERELGSLEAQQQNFERHLESRVELVREMTRKFSIRGFDTDLDESRIKAAVERISRLAREQAAAAERGRQETKQNLSVAQQALTQVNQRKSALNQRKENCRQMITTSEDNISRSRTTLGNIRIAEGDIAKFANHLKEAEESFQGFQSTMEQSDFERALTVAESELRGLDERREQLDAELFEVNSKAADLARVDLVGHDLKEKEDSLATLLGVYTAKLSAIIGPAWTQHTVRHVYQATLDEHRSLIDKAEKQRDVTSRELEQLDFELKTNREALSTKRAELSTAASVVRSAVGGEPEEYLDALDEMENSADVLKADAAAFAVINKYFDRCIADAKSSHACRTCTRSLKQQEIDTLVRAVERERLKFLTDSSTKQQQLELERSLQEAKDARPSYDTFVRLSQDEIPALELREGQLASSREEFLTRLELEDAVVASKVAAHKDVEAFARNVETIAFNAEEITALKNQHTELLARQKSQGVTRSSEQLRGEFEQNKEKTKAAKARIEKITGERDRLRASMNDAEHLIWTTKSKLSGAEQQLKEKTAIEEQVTEHQSFIAKQRSEIQTIDDDLRQANILLKQAQLEYDDIAKVGETKDSERQAQLNQLNNGVHELKIANEQISTYITEGGAEQLEHVKAKIDETRLSVHGYEAEQVAVSQQIKNDEERLRDVAETKRRIADNQRYRRDLRQLKVVREEIAELETHNAEDEKTYYEREGHHWQLERNKIAAEQATIVGTLRSKDDQLKQILADWETDYKDAAQKYKKAHIKVETTKACIEDLGRYGGALDKAIMKYHSIKMTEINRIIDELWRKTYQGTDVDTIMIRSESEEGSTAARGNKSYNYRVCMVKQDAEMDMRGRCSAGQKVLASIIIRLALAECFGINCGIIALDEPTTNLDRDNIRALAESLAEIIRFRRQQRNFQLIVITHDEEFLRYMSCSDFADVYYRVSRNEKMKSIIERQSIAEVM